MNKIPSFGKTFAKRSALLAIALVLGGCFDDGSSSESEPILAPADPPPAATNHPPEISGTPPASVTAMQAYSFTPAATDADNDFLEFSVTNQPAWATFSDTTGTLSGTPADTHVGDTDDITITVTDGRDTRSIGPFKIKIHPRNNPPSANGTPTISGTPSPSVMAGAPYSFQPTATDPEGDALTFAIANRPSWATFSTSTGRLSGTPATGNVATYSNIVISVSDGHTSASLPAFAIQVQGPANRAPTISGSPATSVQAGQAYTFQPSASDPDGDTLTYSIANRPAWATFNTSNGRLSGTPAAANVGSYPNVSISVSDGRATASLPAFTITVQAAANRAPTISGSPSTSVNTGVAYTFTPNASDPDGDTLGFTIQNRPSWASFDTATGRLSGTPTAAGSHANIVISVSDGTATASLPAFTLTVAQTTTGNATVSWTAPTTNTDGSAITNLAGFRINYGTSAGALSQTLDVANPGASSYVVNGLASGTWYFAVSAYTNAGAESTLSSVASKTIP
jgi:hypothetical protein